MVGRDVGMARLVTYTFCTFVISTSPVIHLACPPKFCIAFVSHFSWVLQSSQEKLKTMLMQHFGRQMRCIVGDVEMANNRFGNHI